MTFDDVFLLVNETYGIPTKSGWHKLSPDTAIYVRGITRLIFTPSCCFGIPRITSEISTIELKTENIRIGFIRDCLTNPDISIPSIGKSSNVSFDVSHAHRSLINHITNCIEHHEP